MEEKLGIVFDYVVILQPTSPFRIPDDIDNTLKKLIKNKADSAVSLMEVGNYHPMRIKKLEGDRVLDYCMAEQEGIRRQDLPTAYKRSGAVYAMTRNLLMEQNRLYGDYNVGLAVPQERSIDIDEPVDWLKAEYMLKELKQKGYEF